MMADLRCEEALRSDWPIGDLNELPLSSPTVLDVEEGTVATFEANYSGDEWIGAWRWETE